MLDGGIFSFIMLIVLISLIVVIVFVIEDEDENIVSNLWVAAGKDSGEGRKNLMWSESGKIWNHSSGAGDKFDELGHSVAYGKDIWVAGGKHTGGGRKNIMTSVNGKSWNHTVSGGSIKTRVSGLKYAKGMWVAVGNNNTFHNTPPGAGSCWGNIMWSDNGSYWNPVTEGSCFKFSGNDVDYGEDKWVAVGDNYTPAGHGLSGTGLARGNIMYSDDGKTWTATSEGASMGAEVKGVVYGKTREGESRWVAVGENEGTDKRGNIMWSRNGTCWISVNEGSSFYSFGLGVGYGKDENGLPLWVAVGDDAPGFGGTSYGNIMWSENGTCWFQTNSGDSFSALGFDVHYSKGLWVAVGKNTPGDLKNIMTSTNGKTWTTTSSGDSFSTEGRAVSAKL